jgi:excisionase family DNA binding protein
MEYQNENVEEWKTLKNVFLTTKEVAQLLKCDVSTVNNWAKRKILIKHYIGGRVYYRAVQVDQAVKSI